MMSLRHHIMSQGTDLFTRLSQLCESKHQSNARKLLSQNSDYSFYSLFWTASEEEEYFRSIIFYYLAPASFSKCPFCGPCERPHASS